MTQVEQIKADIEALPQREFAQLRTWFAEKDWALWNRQIEADVADGKLDFLLEETMSGTSSRQATGLVGASNTLYCFD